LKLNAGVNVAESPPWIIAESLVTLVAVASGTTVTVTEAVAFGPLVGATVNVYVNVPLMLPVTVTLPPLEIVVAPPSVAPQEGAHESVAGALPVVPLPPNEAKSFVEAPLLIATVPLEVA
jgi:hypothetical protein